MLEEFNIVADVEEFVLEDWHDLIQPFMMLSQLNPFKDDEIGKMLHIENYQSLIDPSKERPPMPGKGGFQVKGQDGSNFEVNEQWMTVVVKEAT